jgi:hypothetical protein
MSEHKMMDFPVGCTDESADTTDATSDTTDAASTQSIYYTTDISYGELDTRLFEDGGCDATGTATGTATDPATDPATTSSPSYYRKRVLFVIGFGTNISTPESIDSYKSIRNYFLGRDDLEVQWFEYNPDQLLTDVYQGLQAKVESYSPDALIGHSLGGLLVYRYMVDRMASPTMTGHPLPFPILLMPFLQRPADILYRIIDILPRFVRNTLKIPFEIGFPAYKLWDEGNVLNARYDIVSFRQLFDAADIMTESEDEIVKQMVQMNAWTIYANDDNSTKITDSLLRSLLATQQFFQINGKHEAFSSRKNSSLFFEVFNEILRWR